MKPLSRRPAGCSSWLHHLSRAPAPQHRHDAGAAGQQQPLRQQGEEAEGHAEVQRSVQDQGELRRRQLRRAELPVGADSAWAQVDMNKVKFEVMKPWITREMSHQTRPAQLRRQRSPAAYAQSE